jgi:protoporphyrinogen oxidase
MKIIIIGGGPAGLTAAYQLSKEQVPAIVLEKDNLLGGLSRTESYNGFLFDIGGHRFFTKVEAVEKIWREVLSEGDFPTRERLSRIYFNRRFFPYPLRISASLLHVGLTNLAIIPFSFLKARIFPEKQETNFEQWISNRFGKKLYEIFFKTYTEKVWGVPGTEISADWAAQRIKGLSVGEIFKGFVRKQSGRQKSEVVKTLINEFNYPRRGPGMMWEAMGGLIEKSGGEVRKNSDVTKIIWDQRGVRAVEINRHGKTETVEGTDFISSMPIRELFKKLSPPPPPAVLEAAGRLRYRDFLTVALIIDKPDVFPDNWIYVHEPRVKLGRVQNFKNWSPEMVKDQSQTCLGLEYFCFAGDELWEMPENELIDLAKRELAEIGLVEERFVVDGKVLKIPNAYPVYDGEYKDNLMKIRAFLKNIANLQLVGRNGMHKYNNQDHSMLTAMLAVENILLGAKYDLWDINTEDEYQEEKATNLPEKLKEYGRQIAVTQPVIPKKLSPELNEE